MFALDMKLAFKKPYFVIHCFDIKSGKSQGDMNVLFNSHKSAQHAVLQFEFMYGDCFKFVIREVPVYKCDTNIPLTI